MLINFFSFFFDLYKEYNNFLILFLSFKELFLAFNCAKDISNLVSICSGVNIFSPFPDKGCKYLLKSKESSISRSVIFAVSFGYDLTIFLNLSA